jgi:Transposase domain (DUF772)
MQGKSAPDRQILDAAAFCRQLVPEGSVEAFLADHRGELFPDELVEDLFPSTRGRPSVPADVIASVMVLQALEGFSDRDAARALRDLRVRVPKTCVTWQIVLPTLATGPGRLRPIAAAG